MSKLSIYYPVGTPNELKEMELSTNRHHNCSEPTATNRGCRHFPYCRMAFKGKEHIGKEGETLPNLTGGAPIPVEGMVVGEAPERIAVYRESASSGRVKTMAMECYAYYDRKVEWDQNKDTVHILGGAGYEFPAMETKESQRMTSSSQMTGGRMPQVDRVRMLRKVEPFPRPMQVEEERMKAVDIRRHIQQATDERARREFMTGMREPEFTPEATVALKEEGAHEQSQPPSGKRRGG